MSCIHAIAAIMKRHERDEDYVHPWPAVPIIKRPIGRSKVHKRKKDPSEHILQGDKLKKSFQVTCSKCGEKGHNFKSCKCAPSKPDWQPCRKGARKNPATQQAEEVQVSQSAPQPEAQVVRGQAASRTGSVAATAGPSTQATAGTGSIAPRSPPPVSTP
ncbi:hypothetical protein PIB30_091796 [Stylosanthes scabra]|uniref:CCHC-type domain-containing protein n=1 Tax=Stylosanthes scabra TaxID=79078 RepID=A0ABU6UVD1_9FABA|nr:hypothetical protein [Stylosanthes scabra]